MAAYEKHNNFMAQFRMYISVFAGLILVIVEGAETAWSSPIIKKFNSSDDNPLNRRLTDGEKSWLISISLPGMILGSIIFGALSSKIGRKPLLLSLCLPKLTFFLTLAFTKYLPLYYVARVIGGVGSGGTFIILPMYICEVSDPKVRGSLCFSIGIFLNIGILLTYAVAPYISFMSYHVIIAVIAITFLALFYVCALESPYYLLENDASEAERVLQIFRGKSDVSKEIHEMKEGRTKTSEGTVMDIFKNRGTIKALATALGLSTFIMTSGATIFSYYAEFIFDAAEGNWSGEMQTIIVGVLQLITPSFVFFITDKFERKQLLGLSFIGVGISEITIGTFFLMKETGRDVSSLGWLPLASFMAYIVSYNTGIGPLSFAVSAELFPMRVKSAALALCVVYEAFIGFVITLSYTEINSWIGMGPTFYIYAGFSFAGAIFLMVYMVNVNGKSLDQIQDDLNETKSNNINSVTQSEI